MFLLLSAYQALKKTEDVSLIIFKTKEEDLLHIHELQENKEDTTKKEYKPLNLKVEPFENVTYFLP
jgi:hypothetical protein